MSLFDVWSWLLREEQKLHQAWQDVFQSFPTAHIRELVGDVTQEAALRDALSSYREFQNRYDFFMNKKLGYFASWSVETAKVEVSRLGSLGIPLRRFVKKANQHRLQFESEISLFGTDDDHRRIESFKNIFFQLRRFTKMKGSIEAKKLKYPFDPVDNILVQAMGDRKIAPKVLGIIKRLIWNRRSGAGETPVADALFQVYREMAQAHSIAMQFQDDPGIHYIPKPNELTLILHNHTHAFYDFVALSQLKGRGIALMGNVDHTLPKQIADMVDKVDHIILVGRDWDESMKKIIQLVREGKAGALMVSSEAYTSTGLFDTRPNRKRLEDWFVRGLTQNGIRVSLDIFTIPNSFRFMNLWGKTELDPHPADEAIQLSYNGHLSPEQVALLCADPFPPHSLGVLVREIWLEQLDSRQPMFLGAPSVEAQKDLIRRYLEI